MTQFIAVRDEGCGFGLSYCGPFHRRETVERFKVEVEKAFPKDPPVQIVQLEDPTGWLPERGYHNGHHHHHDIPSLLASGSAAPAAGPTSGRRSS